MATSVAGYRQRLADLGWFMKALKEPLARLPNKEDDCKGVVPTLTDFAALSFPSAPQS